MSFLLIFIIYSYNLHFITRGTNLFEINRLGTFPFVKESDRDFIMGFEELKGCFDKSWKQKKKTIFAK